MEKYIQNAINKIDPKGIKSRIRLHKIENAPEENSTHKIATIYGGLNGRGDWVVYLIDIAELIGRIQNQYDCWLYSLQNDPPDDVFELKICIREKSNY